MASNGLGAAVSVLTNLKNCYTDIFLNH